MKKAIGLAKKARGATHPNPMVGALIVKKGVIIASGFHKKAGLDHAEVIALKKAGEKAKGATLYVNLEPCSHFGKTPPCVDRIIKSGLKRVVIGTEDPNPINTLKGIKKLKKSGLIVNAGILREESVKLNEDFAKFITRKVPFVIIKAAQSLDGKIASVSGDSKWISCLNSRKYAHKLRAESDAVMVGIETVIKDNPRLDCRLYKSFTGQPLKIVVDSRLRISLKAKILNNPGAQTLIATTRYAPKDKIRKLEAKNARVLIVRSRNKRVDLKDLFIKLAKENIVSILVEGGARLITSLINQRLADKIVIFIAPKIIGGSNAPTFCEGKGIKKMKDAIVLNGISAKRINGDLIVEAYL